MHGLISVYLHDKTTNKSLKRNNRHLIGAFTLLKELPRYNLFVLVSTQSRMSDISPDTVQCSHSTLDVMEGARLKPHFRGQLQLELMLTKIGALARTHRVAFNQLIHHNKHSLIKDARSWLLNKHYRAK